MPRPPRIQYPGAIYHVINRGNYRSDVFAEVGAAHAFVETMKEAVDRYGWRLGAYVVMRNHYHLSIQTPEPNLSAGMPWLQRDRESGGEGRSGGGRVGRGGG